jgi:hypothetical protein
MKLKIHLVQVLRAWSGEDLQRCPGGVDRPLLVERTGPPVGNMCNTPTYCDLGKAAKDVFNKGYGFGMVKIDMRTKSCSGVVSTQYTVNRCSIMKGTCLKIIV